MSRTRPLPQRGDPPPPPPTAVAEESREPAVLRWVPRSQRTMGLVAERSEVEQSWEPVVSLQVPPSGRAPGLVSPLPDDIDSVCNSPDSGSCWCADESLEQGGFGDVELRPFERSEREISDRYADGLGVEGVG